MNNFRALIFFLALLPFHSLHAMEEEGLKNPLFSKSISEKEALGTDQALAEKVLQTGYFVHVAPLNLQKEDFVLRSGAAVPTTIQGGDAMSQMALLIGEMSGQDGTALANLFKSSTNITTYLPEPKAFRPCLYFSLNSMVGDHGEFNFSSRNFAVLIPVKHLLDSIVNFYPADTAVWIKELDLKTIEDCVIFARKDSFDSTQKNWGKADLREFEGSILDTVDKYITKTTGYPVNLKNAPQGQDIQYDQALCSGINLNNPELYSSVFKNKLHLSFGHESAPQRAGTGPWLKFYHTFIDEFLRLWKQGHYAASHEPPKLMKQYKVEPYIVLAEYGILEMQRLLASTSYGRGF